MNTDDRARNRIEQITAAINAALDVKTIDVADESHLHVGHAGARTGMGHFHVTVVAAEFTGLSLIKRHQLVYSAVGELMKTDIHALGIEAIAPGERAD